MSATFRAFRALVLFSTALGVVFLWQVYALLPPIGFDIVSFGWVLFVIVSLLTFVRPRASLYMGFIVSLAALGASLGEPYHYTVLQSGTVLAVSTLLLGISAQVLLLVLIPVQLYRSRKGT